MRILSCLIFLLSFSGLLLAEQEHVAHNHLSKHNNIKIKEARTIACYTFDPLDNASLTFIQKAEESGYIANIGATGQLYLLDSYLYDPIFKDLCKSQRYRFWNCDSSTNWSDIDFFALGFRGARKITLTSLNSYGFCLDNTRYYSELTFLLEIKKDELIGYKKKIWLFPFWEWIQTEYTNKKRQTFIASTNSKKLYNFSNAQTNEMMYQQGIFKKQFLPLDKEKITSILKEKLKHEKTPPIYLLDSDYKRNPLIKWNDEEKWSLMKEYIALSSPETASVDEFGNKPIPIMLIDLQHHSSRADSLDWRIYCQNDINTGDFIQYFSFENELNYLWPLYMRRYAMDYLAGANRCKQSTVAVFLNSKEKVVKMDAKKQFDTTKIVMALVNNKQWRPDPVPEDKNTIPEDRLFYKDQPGRIFGSYSKVWDLEIWPRLGIQLKRNPEAEVYLCGYGTLLQAAETKTVEEEHALIKKCGVKITPMMYQSLELMRKKQQQGN